jgi:hypothetical protein
MVSLNLGHNQRKEESSVRLKNILQAQQELNLLWEKKNSSPYQKEVAYEINKTDGTLLFRPIFYFAGR